jgi:pyrimidine-nucleoside phosphorylase
LTYKEEGGSGMRIIDIIEKKKQGFSFNKEEIEFFLEGYIGGTVPDYQIAALLMAIWFQGMEGQEITDLTIAMANSGDKVDLSSIPGIKVDKHSSGGVADTTTLIVAPLVAACGGRVAKMSGRGLGHTGGTIDKLESIPGYQVEQPMERFLEIVSTHGLSVIGQTGDLVPADKKIYGLRDVTATVDSIPLIASSIMSKKLAAGCDAIVLDVKTGSGAFMKDSDSAAHLAETMVDIGTRVGRTTVALVTDMNQPLGNGIGNALEVREAIEILQGKSGGDLKTVAIELAARMLILADIATDEQEAREKLYASLDSGIALDKLKAMIEAHNGDGAVTEDVGLLPRAERQIQITAERSGYIRAMHTDEIGTAAMLLGAGRVTKEDSIDKAVGIWMETRLGDKVKKGDTLAVFHVNAEKNLDSAIEKFNKAIEIGSDKPELPPLIHATITSSSRE